MGQPAGAAGRLDLLVKALARAGIQPGDEIPADAWGRVELLAFGVVDPATTRAYRHALISLGVLEQIGGGRGGVKIRAFRILALPEEPLRLGLLA